MIKGILFDFFGTLVEYSASRVEQGYYATHKLLRTNGIDISYTAFLDSWVAAAESTLFVGDSYEADYLGAKRAGMQALLIDPAGATNASSHDVIGSVLDVKTHIVHAV